MSVTAPTFRGSGFYLQNPLMTDESLLKQRCIAFIEGNMPPGFQIALGSPLDLLASSVAQFASEQADVANQQLDNFFRYFGKLVNVVPIDATPATAIVTLTVKDTAGYTIPAGSVVGAQDSSGTLRGFDLLADMVIVAGASTGTGQVLAEDPGVVANNLSGAAQVVQAPGFVTGASLALSSGGVDAETDPVFLDRLAETLTLLKPGPVLPKDFAVMARSVPGVFRAAAIDLLKPGPPYDVAAEATGQEKTVTVAVTDINGLSVGATIRGNVSTFLQGLREQNFKVYCVDPQYGTIDVTATVYCWPGWGTADVQARVVAALQSALSPAIAGTDPTGNSARWSNNPVIRPSDIYAAIVNVTGVRYVEPLKFGLHNASLLGTPAGLAVAAVAGGGTFTAATYFWKITGLGDQGESLPSSEVTVAVAAGGHANLTWTALANAQGYNIYRSATTGTENVSPALVATVGQVTAYTDTGTATTTGAVPTGNTAEVLGQVDVTIGSGSLIPALPMAGTMQITAIATVP